MFRTLNDTNLFNPPVSVQVQKKGSYTVELRKTLWFNTVLESGLNIQIYFVLANLYDS